ncbi:hypothetical protein BLS_009147 [Venturia inaequalis]|nr:hypothetical protein BLS_009147 [Venturia inaequalis]KAE9972602.1 hypothetical protein EG327_009449 [Venturia inaequalis]RDI83400.1 Cysteine desulfurase [Venturia inaequalis]
MGPRKKSKLNSEANKQKDTPPAEPPTAFQSESSSKPGTESSPLKRQETPATAPVIPTPIPVPSSQSSSQSLRPSTTSNEARNPKIRTPNGSLTESSLASRKSWYGSWTGKGKPVVAEVAKDNVPASPAKPNTTRAFEGERRSSSASVAAPSPRRYMSGSQTPQSKAAASLSVSNLSVAFNQPGEDNSKDAKLKDVPTPNEGNTIKAVPDPPLPPDPKSTQQVDTTQDKADQTQPKEQQAASGGWFGWWSRPDGYVEKSAFAVKDEAPAEAQQSPLPNSPLAETKPPHFAEIPPTPQPSTIEDGDSAKKPQTDTETGIVSRSTWFGLWSTQQNAQAEAPKPPEVSSAPPAADTSVQLPLTMKPADPLTTSETASINSGKDSVRGGTPRKKSTGWAFWSRETPDGEIGDVHKQVGELAVADTPSSTRPEAAQFNEQEEPVVKEPPKEAAKAPLRSKLGSLRGRNRGSGKDKEPLSEASTPAKVTPSGSPTRKANTKPETKPDAKPDTLAVAVKSAVAATKKDTNLLLPEFRSTYSLQQQPSLWDQVRRYVLGSNEHASGAHLHITPTPPRIKKAIAIGIHGFFPSPIFQKILGQPTGTSIRFSNSAAQAIKNWTDERGYECEIEKIALEGEGFIADRVDTLWKLLLNWVEHLRQADFIMVACHSQGVPVAIMLVAKLIAFGCVSGARIGVCAMAGINLGPFAEYKSRIFGGSALELFDFGNPSSKVSQMYQHALEEALRFGTRIVYVGSIDDQLVSMESSTFSTLTHPLIYRAVFVDGRLHTSDFLSNLIGFTLKLRNLGLSDHGLIRELSPAVAGSLYTGEGHSTLYHHLPIYELAVKHSLETTSLAKPMEPIVKKYEGPPGLKEANPYFLPWAMRGILEEEVVKRELGSDIEMLLSMFEEWRPISKGLKDVKFRLEAVRSKL